MRFIERLNLHRHTIARDLTVGLVAVITVVFCVAGTINYFYSLSRDTSALYEKAEEIMDNLASVLVKPLWNIDTAELHKIVDVYRQSGIVLDIRLVDDSNQEMVAPTRNMEGAFLELTRVIHYEKNPIGRVTVAFSDANIVAKQREVAVYTGVIFAILTLALVFATTLLLRRFLHEPFAKLEQGLEVISGGTYEHRFERVRQEDINDITDKVMLMAREIAHRETALEENRQKLEILNQAILDIFSCSDTDQLVRTTMELSNKVCGVDFGWFLPAKDSLGLADEDKQALPAPRVAVRGHAFEATEQEVESYVKQAPGDRVFTFALKNRVRQVGQMTLAFDVAPDPSVTSLLKSLMSLATLALIRQSFIRETAFIAAELQVAEAVQRSMLPDDAREPLGAHVSYHYEPVLRVGGDWFSVIESRERDAVYVILGDVTGHGLAQGLVTTAVAGALQVLESLIHEGAIVSRPSQMVTQLNDVIARIAGKSNLRMTCVAAKLELTSQRLFVCNAGHTFPVVIRKNAPGEPREVRIETLTRNQQIMLGEDSGRSGFAYTDAEYELADGDVLLFYTDGLTEAVDKDGKAFARKFHRYFTRMTAARSVEQVKDELIARLRDHTADVPVKDDICLLAVSRRPKRAVTAA